jgi:hypothetical protein
VVNVDAFQSDWGQTNVSGVPGRPRPGALYVVISGRAEYGGLKVRYPRKRWFTH